MTLTHLLDGGHLFRSFDSFQLLVPGQGARTPVPALRPTADGSRSSRRASRWGSSGFRALPLMIIAAGLIETPAGPQVAVEAEGLESLRRFPRHLIPKCCHRYVFPISSGGLPHCGADPFLGIGPPLELWLLACKIRPALHDHVAVRRVQFHQEGVAAGLLGGDQSGAAAAEEVQDVFAGL